MAVRHVGSIFRMAEAGVKDASDFGEFLIT